MLILLKLQPHYTYVCIVCIICLQYQQIKTLDSYQTYLYLQINPFCAGAVYLRQILTSKDGSRTGRIKKNKMVFK